MTEVVLAADSGQTRLLSLSSSLGQIAPHRPEMSGLLGRRVIAVEAAVGRWSLGNWSVAGRRRGATTWLSLNLSATGSETLGNQAALLGIARWPMRWGLSTETGLGLGWTWTPYDPIERPTATALGSHGNAAIRLGIGRTWGGTAGVQARLALRLTHLSNGGITQPNLGTNQITLALALEHHPASGDRQVPLTPNRFPAPPPLLIALQAGPRDIGLPGGQRAQLWSLRTLREFPGAMAARAWSPVAGGGATVAFRHNERPPQLFIEAGAMWRCDRLAVVGTWGGLVLNANATQGPVFLQVDVLGQIRPQLALSLSLRSYRLRAEHPALGLVWSPSKTPY